MLPTDGPGVPIGERRKLKPFLEVAGPIGGIAATAFGPDARPALAILFDKICEHNSALGWHQDRKIVVKEGVGVVGFGRWTPKSGLLQIELPFDIGYSLLAADLPRRRRVFEVGYSADAAPYPLAGHGILAADCARMSKRRGSFVAGTCCRAAPANGCSPVGRILRYTPPGLTMTLRTRSRLKWSAGPTSFSL